MLLERRGAGINDHVIFVINYPLKIAGSHIKDQADTRRHALEEPDMTNRNSQLNVAHALPADSREGHFDTATIANNSTMFDSFILAAGTFPIFYRSENALTKKSAFFGFERPIINCFGIFDFPFGPGTDGIGRGNLN